MGYRKIFNPDPLFQDFRTQNERFSGTSGDRRDGKIYLYTEPLVTAINVALATGRPLLLRGATGCGKSSVAYNIARVLERKYYEVVINSRMVANDLLWRFDAVRRLGDAQIHSRISQEIIGMPGGGFQWESYYPYIEPQVFWWVFNEKSARRRGFPQKFDLKFNKAEDPCVYNPNVSTPHYRSVVLLDEIDKSEPDVPNNLLVVLGSWQFRVDEIQSTISFYEVQKQNLTPENMPLIIITTNEERQLPDAFLRRCIVYRFKDLDEKELIDIAKQIEGESDLKLYEKVAKSIQQLSESFAERKGGKLNVSVAEYLDAVRACKRLGGLGLPQLIMNEILDRTIWKSPQHR